MERRWYLAVRCLPFTAVANILCCVPALPTLAIYRILTRREQLLAAFYLFGQVYYEAESGGPQFASAMSEATLPSTAEQSCTPEAATDAAAREKEEPSDQVGDDGPDRISP